MLIVELRLPSGAVFKRSPPMPDTEAQALATFYNLHAKQFSATTVDPAKYQTGRVIATEGLDELGARSNQGRSRVE